MPEFETHETFQEDGAEKYKKMGNEAFKAHKWDALPHNTSLWRPHEYLAVSERVVELAVTQVMQLVQTEADKAKTSIAEPPRRDEFVYGPGELHW